MRTRIKFIQEGKEKIQPQWDENTVVILRKTFIVDKTPKITVKSRLQVLTSASWQPTNTISAQTLYEFHTKVPVHTTGEVDKLSKRLPIYLYARYILWVFRNKFSIVEKKAERNWHEHRNSISGPIRRYRLINETTYRLKKPNLTSFLLSRQLQREEWANSQRRQIQWRVNFK